MAVYKHTTETAKNLCKEIHGDKFDYSEMIYVNSKTPITVICPLHGKFSILFGNHTSLKRGCRDCTKQACDYTRATKAEFLHKAKLRHGDKFDYTLVDYISNKHKVKIICPNHGIFEQIPQNHYRYDCLKCTKEAGVIRLKKQENCFSKSGFKAIAKDRQCTLYVIRCFNDVENFYKIGITSYNILKRFRDSKAMPYDFEVLKELYGTAEQIWTIEKDLKLKLQANYIPNIAFGGSVTECYSDIEEILRGFD